MNITKAVERLAEVYKENMKSPHVQKPVANALYKVWKEADMDTNVDRCVCCGEIVPEGRMVCSACERRANEN